MGAKFKATLHSCCFAEMEERHFRLRLVCLSFALVQPFLFLLPSLFYWLPPLFFIPLFLENTRVNSFSSTSFSLPFSFCSCAVSCSCLFFNIWFYGTFGSLQLSCSCVFSFCISIQLSSNMLVFQIWQTLISTQQRGCCPGASLFREPHLTLDPNRALNSKLSKDSHWSEIDSCSALPCRYLPGSKTSPSLSFLSSRLLLSSFSLSASFLFRRWHFHKCLTPAICSLRALQSFPLM